METVTVVKVVAMAAAAMAAAAMGGAAMGGVARGAVAMGAASAAAERVREVASSATLRWSLIVRPVTLTAGFCDTECSGALSVWPPRGHQRKQASGTSAARKLGSR